MTIWERLSKYGHIKNFKRKEDPRRFSAYLEDGLVRVECKKGVSMTLTIDTFLELFMNNLPCDYPQFGVFKY
jgi:hypothetical protein